jgi:hypothetical protein
MNESIESIESAPAAILLMMKRTASNIQQPTATMMTLKTTPFPRCPVSNLKIEPQQDDVYCCQPKACTTQVEP